MKYEWFIGLRYLMSRRKQTFISIISVISVGCVALGITTVIVAIAVMNGFENMLKEKFLGNEAHITVTALGTFFDNYEDIISDIESIPNVVAAAPVIYAQAGIQRESGAISGVIIKGIDPKRENGVTKISDFVNSDSLSFESPLVEEAREESGDSGTIRGGIILGKDVARRLGVHKGDMVIIISRLEPDRARPGGLLPLMRKFVVVDLYDSGMYLYDNILAFLPLDVAQKLYRVPGEVNRIEVLTTDPELAVEVGNEIKKVSKKFGILLRTKTWMEMNPDFFGAMKMEKFVTFIIEGLIIVVAAFGIASTLIMMAMEKIKDVGILKAMGARKESIRLIFIIEGSVIGILGAIFGTFLGLGLCFLIQTFNIPMPYTTVYQISTLPAKINWPFVALVNAVSLFICWIATLYPAWHASNMNPVEALRYE